MNQIQPGMVYSPYQCMMNCGLPNYPTGMNPYACYPCGYPGVDYGGWQQPSPPTVNWGYPLSSKKRMGQTDSSSKYSDAGSEGFGMSESGISTLFSNYSESLTTKSSKSSKSTKSTKSTKSQVEPRLVYPENYELCDCDVALPNEYYIKVPPPVKKKPKMRTITGVWCGSDECGLKNILKPDDPLTIKRPLAKIGPAPIPPGTCCSKQDQVIFQMAEDDGKLPVPQGDCTVYKVGDDHKPQQVQMARFNDQPEMDTLNDTFLITVSKKDDKGNPAKLHLAVKTPRPIEVPVCTTETPTEILAGDFARGKKPKKNKKGKGKKGKKGKKGNKGKKKGKGKKTKGKPKQKKK